MGETETRLECLLNNNKNSDFCAPLTSFDWNEVDPYLLGKMKKNREVGTEIFQIENSANAYSHNSKKKKKKAIIIE